MTREKIAEHAALVVMAVFRNLDQPGGVILDEATNLLVNFHRATLQEAARAVCGDCGAGVQLLPQTAEWEWGHPDDDGYRYDCAAAPIHDLIAALEEGS